MIRYLGVGLGLAMGCGICSATGTLVPPILKGQLHNLYGTPSANVSLLAVGVSIVGIVLVGLAGMSKESELPDEEKKKTVADYNFKLGLIVAIASGFMSAGMSFGLQGGPEIEALARQIAPATSTTWSGMPVLVTVLLGGFLVNGVWCAILNLKNKTGGDYIKTSSPLAGNFIFAALAGTIWCSQFICFKNGEPKMGNLSYIGWAVLMGSMILFSSLLGIVLGEWKGTSVRTRWLLGSGLAVLMCALTASAYSGHIK
jgi:L-rhamnose-H+ transport protein